MKKNKVNSVVIVGGTHGNELTGIYLVKQCQKEKLDENYSSFSLGYLLANSRAIKENRRYIDIDLNRSFKLPDLSDANLQHYESKLAKTINNELGPKGQSKTDFIIDLHTSTANMQINIVITRIDKFHLQLASYLKQTLLDVTVTSEAELLGDHHFLESIAPNGVLIEIGSIAQGCIEYPIIEKTRQAMLACLEFVELYNNDSVPDLPEVLETFSYYSKVKFPLDEMGEISASVHPSLIGKAYPLLKKGDLIFKTFAGEDIPYSGETTHLSFINEAAYYDKKIAMCLCEQANYSLKTNRRIK